MPIAMQYGSGDSIAQRIGGGGGISITLVWTNPNPTSSFSAQTVSIDLSSYDALLYICYSDVSAQRKIDSFTLIDGDVWAISGTAGDSSYNYNRFVTPSSTGLVFQGGRRNGSSGNGYCVPIKIYGIKGIS